MKKREAAFSTRFGRWANHHLRPPAYWETKHTLGKDYLPFTAVKKHQRAWALAAIGPNGKSYKISDQGAGHKPGDGILFGMMDAWIAIQYPGCFVVIDIEKFLEEEKKSDRKSLTEKRAKQIAAYVV